MSSECRLTFSQTAAVHVGCEAMAGRSGRHQCKGCRVSGRPCPVPQPVPQSGSGAACRAVSGDCLNLLLSIMHATWQTALKAIGIYKSGARYANAQCKQGSCVLRSYSDSIVLYFGRLSVQDHMLDMVSTRSQQMQDERFACHAGTEDVQAAAGGCLCAARVGGNAGSAVAHAEHEHGRRGW